MFEANVEEEIKIQVLCSIMSFFVKILQFMR